MYSSLIFPKLVSVCTILLGTLFFWVEPFRQLEFRARIRYVMYLFLIPKRTLKPRARKARARDPSISGIVSREMASSEVEIVARCSPRILNIHSYILVELKRFFRLASDCDIDGVIVLDLSVEESEEYKRLVED